MHVDDVPLEAPAQWIEKGVPTALLSATKRQSDYDLDHDRLMRHAIAAGNRLQVDEPKLSMSKPPRHRPTK